MICTFLYEKYKNLNSEEEFVNNYCYQKPINLKHKETSKFKRPKLFHINKYVENYESFKSGSKKTLQEFQNLYIHKFLINNNKHFDKIKKTLDSYVMKEKSKQQNKIINDKEKNIKEEAFSSLIKIIKSNNKGEKTQRSRSRSIGQINKLYNYPQSSSKSIRRSQFNLTGKNKYLSYQILKQGEQFLNNLIKTPENTSEKKPFHLFQEKSRMALLKQISAKIIKVKTNQNIALTNKLNGRCHSNYKIRNIIKTEHDLKLEENKNCFESCLLKNYINKTKSVNYYEMSKKGFNLSDALIVERKRYPNSTKKHIKTEKKKPIKFPTSFKRPLSSLEKYYIKYGAIP